MQNTGEVRAAAYVRVVPSEQATKDDQRRRLEAYVGDRGWELVGVHEDVGVSARPRNQPALRSLLANLSGVDKLVILRLDRLGRSLLRTTELLQELQAGGTDLVSVEDGFDTGAPSGRAVPKLIESFAQWEWWDKEGRQDGWRAENLSKPGLSPMTVIDVGAGHGTPTLYEAFPDAYHALIEPLSEFESDLRRVINGYRGEYLCAAIGDREGSVTIDVDREQLTLSSVRKRGQTPPGWGKRIRKRKVPMTTLDKLLEERGWTGPFGLKIDTEGFEDQVIRGAERVLGETQFVIAELSGGRLFEGSYSFAEFIGLMDSRGFRFCDVLHMQKSRGDREVAALDVMFRRG